MEVEKALYCGWNIIELSIAFFIFFLWGRMWGKNLRVPQWKPLAFLIFGVIVCSAFMMATYGYHYEVTEQHDDWHEGRYVQDFEPTKKERYEYGSKVFLFFLALSLIGYFSGREMAREYEESYTKRLQEMRNRGLINLEGEGHREVGLWKKRSPFSGR